ncbi:hypothetical protein B0H63DRAFT_486277 [Podospora didyma]|uniref:Secreted protein n=1 Tax=Podospora didyma TaxID=330526 RepID=A0AAE0K6C9_9PEZI|nr:hypothetical protein B0H63DRAFT_486277 [Podospora didyma]
MMLWCGVGLYSASLLHDARCQDTTGLMSGKSEWSFTSLSFLYTARALSSFPYPIGIAHHPSLHPVRRHLPSTNGTGPSA